MIALVIIAVAFGAFSQRATGMGLALVASPVLLLVLEPITAVILINLCGIVSGLLIAARTWRYVDWHRYRQIGLAAVIGAIPGTIILLVLPSSWLKIGIGGILIVSLLLSTLTRRTENEVDGLAIRVGFGLAFGFIGSSAAVGGPAISVYAILSRWKQQSFAATMQPLLLTIAGVSVLSKVIIDPASWPNLDWREWAGIAFGLAAGLATGDALSSRIKPSHARLAVVIVAYLGAAAAIVKGLTSL